VTTFATALFPHVFPAAFDLGLSTLFHFKFADHVVSFFGAIKMPRDVLIARQERIFK
jgi:hypothetical protein